MIEEIVLQHGNANVVRPGYYVRRRVYFVDQENRGFVVVTLGRLPGQPSQKVSVVERGIVVAPVGDVLHRTRAGHRSLEARGLSDEPVGHVAAVTIAADGEVARMGNAISYQRVHPFENVLTRAGNYFRDNSHEKPVAIAN